MGRRAGSGGMSSVLYVGIGLHEKESQVPIFGRDGALGGDEGPYGEARLLPVFPSQREARRDGISRTRLAEARSGTKKEGTGLGAKDDTLHPERLPIEAVKSPKRPQVERPR